MYREEESAREERRHRKDMNSRPYTLLAPFGPEPGLSPSGADRNDVCKRWCCELT